MKQVFANKRTATVILLAVFCFLYLAVKTQMPAVIERLVADGSWDLLNKVTGSTENMSADFYVGQIEKMLTGPLGVMITSVLFLIFSLTFLTTARARTFGFAVFVFLLVTKFETLLFPPYGDAIGGPFAEGIWLARHNFDYVGLFHQPRYMSGGPAVYVFSLYPGFLALGMSVLPNAKSFLIVNHVIVFMLAAAAISVYREILKKIFDERIALLAPIFFLSTPLFQSQVEAINMEVPILFLTILAGWFLINKRIIPAGIFAVLAGFVKGYGIVACAAVLVVGLLLFFISPKGKKRFAFILWGLGAGAVAALVVYLAYIVAYQYTLPVVTKPFSGWPSFEKSFIFYLYAVSLAAFIVHLIRKAGKDRARLKERIRKLLDVHYIPMVIFLFCGLWFMFFLNHFAVSPRYVLILSPFLIFCVVYAVSRTLCREKIVAVLLLAAVVLAGLGSYGMFYPRIDGYNHVLLERSLEYRNDLKLHRALAKVIEEKYARFTIAAPFILAQSLALPELGYVEKDLDVMIYGMRCSYGGIKNFLSLDRVNIRQTLWVGIKSTLPEKFEYPVGPKDVVVEEIYYGKERARLFFGGFAIEKVRRMLEVLKQKNLLK